GFRRASLLGGTPSLTETKSSPRACAPVTRWVLSPASIGGVHLGTRRGPKCTRLTRHAPALPPRVRSLPRCLSPPQPPPPSPTTAAQPYGRGTTPLQWRRPLRPARPATSSSSSAMAWAI